MALWATFIVVIAIVFIVLAKIARQGSTPSAGGGSAVVSSDLLGKLKLSDDVINKVGQGSITNLPQGISAPTLIKDGKPHVIYIGAEYCPYCAAERWPMVIALMRFGSFSNLTTTHSASRDVYPNTATFSFHGSSYASQYLAFNGVETQSNEPSGGSYAPLDTLTAEEQNIMSTYDAPPYVAANSAGSIPFVDFGGRFINSGASLDPSVLTGQTPEQIASALTNAGGALSQGVVGATNVITATLCALTNDQPSNVCSTPVIQGIKSKLAGK